MIDERIKKLKYSKEYLATHIANKKKKIKKVVAGNKLDRGAEKREKILKSLADDDSYSDDEEETSLHQEDLPRVNKKRTNDVIDQQQFNEDEILQRRYNTKRGRWEWETRIDDETNWEPKESFIDEYGEEMKEFQDFEYIHPYGEDQRVGKESVLTQGSLFVFNHTKKLASAQVDVILLDLFHVDSHTIGFISRH